MQHFGLFCAVIVFLLMATMLLQARNVINALTKENEQLEREATDYADAYHTAVAQKEEAIKLSHQYRSERDKLKNVLSYHPPTIG